MGFHVNRFFSSRGVSTARGIFCVLAAAALAACGGDGQAANSAQPAGRSGPGGGPGGPGARIPVVETVAVEVGTIARTISVTGVVEPIRSVAVNSQLSGALTSVNVEEGSAVRQGAVLARIDARELAAQVASAEASYEVARSTYERAQQLRERQVITEAEFERDRAAAAAAQAQLTQLRTRLGFATITAPISGVITEKNVEAGDIVAPQTRLFIIGDLSTPVVRVSVSELDVVELRPGDRAEVMLDAYPGRILEGRIRRVFPAADPASRLVPVEVALSASDANIARPGFLARVSFALGARRDTRLVPAGAVVGDAGAEAVFVVEESRASRRPVQTGLTSRGQIEILSGVEAGEIVVVVGNHTLRDGAEVRVVRGPGAETRQTGAGGELPAARGGS